VGKKAWGGAPRKGTWKANTTNPTKAPFYIEEKAGFSQRLRFFRGRGQEAQKSQQGKRPPSSRIRRVKWKFVGQSLLPYWGMWGESIPRGVAAVLQVLQQEEKESKKSTLVRLGGTTAGGGEKREKIMAACLQTEKGGGR